MKLLRGRREARAYDPHRPHPYQSGGDAGIAPVAMNSLGMSGSGGGPANVAVTNRYLLTTGCAVAGCGRMPDDAIHAPED